jgi:putative intracellular protease/amidase
MTTSKPANLQVAICIFPGVEVLDYQGPVSFLGFLSPNAPVPLPPDQKFSLTFTYIAPSLDPVSPIAGPPVVPTQTYASLLTKLTQGEDVGIDILWVPGG